MDSYSEEADFDYEDVIDCLKQFIYQPTIKNIFEELEMTPQDILKSADKNLIDAEEDESLVDYCKRYINFLLIIKITKNYRKEVEKKNEKEEIQGLEDKTIEDSKFLKGFKSALEDGDINKILGLVIRYSTIPVEIRESPTGELKLTPAQLTRYQAYVKSYDDDLKVQLDKYGNIINKKYSSKSKNETGYEENNIEDNGKLGREKINSERSVPKYNDSSNKGEAPKDNINKDDENIVSKIKKEEFSHDKEYYKNFILTSKKHNEEYIRKHPEDEKAIILFKRENVSIEEYFEAVRFYNKINSHIIAWTGGVRLKARDFKSKEEMIEAYNSKLKK